MEHSLKMGNREHGLHFALGLHKPVDGEDVHLCKYSEDLSLFLCLVAVVMAVKVNMKDWS